MNGKNSTSFVMVLQSFRKLQYVCQIILLFMLLSSTETAKATENATFSSRSKPIYHSSTEWDEDKAFAINVNNNALSNQIPLGNGKYQITFIFQSFSKNTYSSKISVIAEDEVLIDDLRSHVPSQSKSFAITHEVNVQDGTLDIIYTTANVTLSLMIKKSGNTTAAPPSQITLLPPDQSEYVAGSAITFTAKIKAGSPTIKKVKFYANNNFIGESKPNSDHKQANFTWENVPAGTYQIKAEAHFMTGTKQVSKSATWLVKEAQASTPPNGKVNGLEYKYYEGSWTQIPPYHQMTPKKKGVVNNFTLNPKMRDDEFGFAFTGYIKIEKSGTYTFYLASDDGSQFFIDDKRLFNNDGTHGLKEVSKQLQLTKGYHPIKLFYFERAGAEKLFFSYAGPGFSKKSVPSSVLYRDKNGGSEDENNTPEPEEPTEPEEPSAPSAGAGKNGLNYILYHGSFTKVAEMISGSVKEKGVVSNFTLSPKKRESYFGFDFTGYIKIEKSGSYTFYTTSDEGSKLWIGSKEVVNNDGPHGKQERSGTITLQAGLHPIKVSFFERSKEDILEVKYAGPGFSKRAIPNHLLYTKESSSSATARTLTLDKKNVSSTNAHFPGEGEKILTDGFNLYPNPARNIVNIQSIEEGQFYLYDAQGQLLQKGIINPAASPYQIKVAGLPKGMYYVKFETKSRTWVKKLVVHY